MLISIQGSSMVWMLAAGGISAGLSTIIVWPSVVISRVALYGPGCVGALSVTAKAWKGLGSGVLEIVESHDGNAYRAVYTVRFEKAIYVLHAFQKKSPSGIRTGKRDVNLVAERLKTAERDYEEQYGKSKR